MIDNKKKPLKTKETQHKKYILKLVLNIFSFIFQNRISILSTSELGFTKSTIMT